MFENELALALLDSAQAKLNFLFFSEIRILLDFPHFDSLT